MASNTDAFQRQHAELLKVIQQLQGLLHTDLEHNAKEAATMLSTLAGTLSGHLAMEDKVLYPTMLAHTDDQMRALAQRYQDEMGDLNAKFGKYKVRWHRAATIGKEPVGFKRESGAIFDAGCADGFSDGTFRPGDPATRGQFGY